MIQKSFIEQVVNKVKSDDNVIGLAVAGSFITNEVDEFSDVDLILITKQRIAPSASEMIKYATSFGNFLNGFTGEHVGEPRVLICLYDNPLLHVDIKFLTLEEFGQHRVENPIIVWDPEYALQSVIEITDASWPDIDYQWIEDRFWTWVHYATLKLGRGENFEALDFLSFIRMMVTSPMLQVKNKRLPRGLRKVEFNFAKQDLDSLIATVPTYDSASIFQSLENTVTLYRDLRRRLFPETVVINKAVEDKTMEYFSLIRQRKGVTKL